jgi:hypothetical protein
VRVSGVREMFGTLATAGTVTAIEPLCAQPYGEMQSVIEDLNGYVIVFAVQA